MAGESAGESDGWKGTSQGTPDSPRPYEGPGQLSTASSAGEPTLSTSVTLVIHFLKASSAPAPTLALVPTPHLCTPRNNHGVIVSGLSEDADLGDGHGPYSFAVGPNPTMQRDWRIQALNGVWWGKGEGCGPDGRGVAPEERCPSILGVGPGLEGAAFRGPTQASDSDHRLWFQQVPMPISPWPCTGWSQVNT